nr:nipped B protein (delangin) (scc2) [Hymenolepis microstoma]
MLGDIGRIPIISLSGCKSLSDILSELPLPQPLPKTVSGPELIDDPQAYQEAQTLLQSHNDFLVESISSALASTTTDGIVLKNDQPHAPIDFHTLPPVLKDAITKIPNILEENRSFKCIYSSKEVLQILNKEVGKSSAKMTSPTQPIASSNARHQPSITGPIVAPVGEVGGSGNRSIYSVTTVEPLKLSIKRASIPPTTQEPSKKSRVRRRSKNSTNTSGSSSSLSNSVIPGNQSTWPINPAESMKPQDVSGTQVPIPIHSSPSIVQQSSRHHQLLSTAAVAPVPPGLPNPSPSVQLVIPPPPPTTSSTSRKSGQMLSNVFNQLLHSEQDSTIASLLSSSDGQSMGTPASMEPSFHPRSPPLSVPSNCSYPATPGMNSSNLSVNNPNVGSVGPVPDPSPINAIFDTTAGTNTDLSDGRGDSNPQPTVPPQPPPPPPPRGLAAYLQKSRHHTEAVASPEEGDAYARQHGSVPPMSSSASSPWTERRSGAHASTVSNVGAGVYPTSSSSLTSTPNGQEAGTKEKRGRRRKSELEGLINWQVRDQTTPLKKQHSFHSHQIPPILETNSPPLQHPSSSHHSSRVDVNPSDNEVISGFTEPLGERVKRRRQQHKTPPRSVGGCGDTVLMNKAPIGKSGSSNKNSGSKRPREDTPSEISLSPKRERRGRPPRQHQIPSSDESEEEVSKMGGGDGDGGQNQDDNASISSCLTDSPVPRKHFLQRLVEESNGRPPSLQGLNNLRPAPMSGTPVPVDEHVSSNYINSPPRRRFKKTSSSRASTSPPPLLPFQHDSSGDKKERHRLKKRRQIHQPPFSSDDEDEDEKDEIRRTRKSSHRSMLVADQLPQTKHKSSHGQTTDVSSPSSQVHRKRRKAPAISSSSSTMSSAQSSSSSSEDFKSTSFGKQRHGMKNTSHSSQEERLSIQRLKRELTPSTDPCTDSSEYEACDNDGLASSSKYDEPLSDLSDSDRAEMIIEAEKRIAEEVAKFAATATDFSNHISQFLLRVGGLDLLKFAGEMNVAAVDPVVGHGDDSATMVDQTPVEARLSRREVNALYNEAEEVRVAGSISDEPSGRLVRFLNLLRIHIRDASALMAPNPTIADFKDLIQRRKARLDRRNAGGSGNSDNAGGNRELISEAILWSHPIWMRVLRGLDSALIALHIIAGPDVPRGRLLAMEELVESITAITQFHFSRLTSVIHLPQGDVKRSSTNIAADLTNIARESLGTRLSEALTGLASLVRLHPTRFTDSLIIHLTELAILVISCGLSSGTCRRSPPPGSSNNAAIASIIYPEPAPTPIPGESEERWERRQSVYRERNAWRLQLQRSALALVSTIFLQYDKHRHMVAADILNNLVFSPLKAASNASSSKAAGSAFTKNRNFWVLASGSFLNDWTPFCQASQSGAASNMVANNHFLRVHPFTAVLMALIQGLIPAPSYVCGGGGRRSSSAGAPATPSSGVSQQSTTTGTGMSEQCGILDTNQLMKEEKALSTGYTNAILTSQYFMTDIFRKVNAKGEENFRPLIETVIIDLLRVAADAPVEWPAANLILSVFGQSFMQHVNNPPSTSANSSKGSSSQGSSSGRNACPNTRAIALECLITLAGGMYQLEKIRYSTRKTGGVDISEVRSALSAFLSSPILGLYNLTLTTDDAPNTIAPVDHVKQREFAFKLISRLRYTYFDGLSLAAKRFHLVTWLHEINQELTSTNPGPNDERRKQLEEMRKNLLIEFASTHHSISGNAPWLPPPRGAGVLSTTGGSMSVSGGGGGCSGGTRAGLISPAASEPSVAWGSGPLSDTKLALYTGYGMGADSRRKKIARAHRLATKIVPTYSHIPIGFDVLYMQIVKMVHDSSLAIRTRAIRGLSTLVEIYPECIPVPTSNEENSSNLNASDLISIIPLRLMDNSPMVREAAVELAARLVTIPTSGNSSVFLTRLFKHLINRVLDLQISVRKRAIKSLQNLLLLNQHSDNTEETRRTSQTLILSSKQRFEACVTLLRRSNDEESIKKIVMETFTSLWFTPLSTSDPSKMASRLEKHSRNICEIVLHVRNRVAGVVEDFMKSILNQDGPEKAAQVDTAASQIVEFLVKMIQRLHNANWHVANCQFHPKHQRENESITKPNCECSSQPPDGLSPSNTFLLLSMIAKPRPQLLLQHVPFITKVITSIMPPNSGSVPDGNALSYAIEIIEPCCFHVASKGGTNLSQLFPNGTISLEDCLVYLLQRHCRVVVDASLSCLATIVNHLTKDYTRVAVCFANFYECLIQEKKRKLPVIKPMSSSSMSGSNSLSVRSHWRARPKVLRAVYTVGLICKLFSLQDLANAAFELVNLPKGDPRLPPDVNISILTNQASSGKNNRDEVFNTLMFFAETALLLNVDEETRRAINTAGGYDVEMAKKAIAGLSFLANRHDYLFRSSRLQDFFKSILSGVNAAFPKDAVADLQCIVLDCINNFLVDEEKTAAANDSNWSSQSKQESLKVLGDTRDVHGSTVVQIYLQTALEHCVTSASTTVRTKALTLISTAMRQGLMMPFPFIAALICLQTDVENTIKSRAVILLQEIAQQHSGFLALKAAPGIRSAFQLQKIIAASTSSSGSSDDRQEVLIRGAYVSKPIAGSEKSDATLVRPTALNHPTYSLLQSNKHHRRSLISNLVNRFDNDYNSQSRSSYASDNGTSSRKSSSAGVNSANSDSPSGDNGLQELVFICDQLAHFPYKTVDEIYYLARILDIRVSTIGSAIARSLQDCLLSSAHLKTESAYPGDTDNATELPPAYDRKIANLLEDVESELFVRSSMPSDIGAIESKVIDRINRPVAAVKRQLFREKVVRHAPPCLLLMSLRKYLEEAYDVTSNKLGSYSPSSDDKHYQRFIPPPSVRTLNSGVPSRLIEIPPLVAQCALDPSWPRSTSSNITSSSISNSTILRLALQVHRQLLTVDGVDDELGNSSSNNMPSNADQSATAQSASSRSAVGPSGDGPQQKKPVVATPTHRDVKPSHNEHHRSQSKTSTKTSYTPSKQQSKRSAFEVSDGRADDLSDSLSSLSDGSSQFGGKYERKRKRLSPAAKSSKQKSTVEGTGSIPSKHTRTNTSAFIPKKDTSTAALPLSSSSKKKRQSSSNPIVQRDPELSSLSSLEGDNFGGGTSQQSVNSSQHHPHKRGSSIQSSSSISTSHKPPNKKPSTAGTPTPSRPKYDLAPLPGTPDIRTQHEQRRKAKALAAKKAVERHQLMEKSKQLQDTSRSLSSPHNVASQQARNESRRSCRPRLEADDSDENSDSSLTMESSSSSEESFSSDGSCSD